MNFPRGAEIPTLEEALQLDGSLVISVVCAACGFPFVCFGYKFSALRVLLAKRIRFQVTRWLASSLETLNSNFVGYW